MRAAGAYSDRAAGAVLIFAGAVMFLPCLAMLPLCRAEAMYALIPREMLATGTWLSPTLNGAPYLDKPPLLYWLTILAFHLGGQSELAARIPNLLCALGEIWLTYLIGLHLLNRRAAWLGGFILLTSLGFFSLHLVIYADHLIALTLTASLYFFLRWQDRPGFRWQALFYGSLAAGFLSKGLIGLAFPLLICALYAFSLRQPGLLAFFLSGRGWAIVFLLTAPWLTAMEIMHPGFLPHHFLNEQILRFLGQRSPPDINTFSAPAFWLILVLWLLPWTPLLPEALYRFWAEAATGRGGNPQGRLLLIWPGVVMGFFTLAASRTEYYSLPALAPLALVLGWRIERFLKTPEDHSLLWALLGLAFLGMTTLAGLPYLEALFAANRREFIGLMESAGPSARQVVVILPILAAFGGVAGWRHRPLGLAACGILALALPYFAFQAWMALSPLMSDKVPGEYIRRHAGPDDLVVMEYIEEFEYGASLAFYARRRILMVRRGELPRFPYPVAQAENYLISSERLKDLWQATGRVFVLADNVVNLEPYLKHAPVQVSLPGKHLLVNRVHMNKP